MEAKRRQKRRAWLWALRRWSPLDCGWLQINEKSPRDYEGSVQRNQIRNKWKENKNHADRILTKLHQRLSPKIPHPRY